MKGENLKVEGCRLKVWGGHGDTRCSHRVCKEEKGGKEGWGLGRGPALAGKNKKRKILPGEGRKHPVWVGVGESCGEG